MKVIGWLGSIMLATCGAPQAWKSYRTKSSGDISSAFLSLWAAGEIFTLIYVAPTLNYPLIVNYVFNLLFIGVIVKYKGGK
jgi:uncharacterized protein with PQ loop repeat